MPITAAIISYDGRQSSFTPGASVGTMQTNANGFVLIGSAPLLAMKLKCVSARRRRDDLRAADDEAAVGLLHRRACTRL